jgi:hypothetical protein
MPAEILMGYGCRERKAVQGRRNRTRRNNSLVKLKCSRPVTNFRRGGQVCFAFLFQAGCSDWTEETTAAQHAHIAIAISIQVDVDVSGAELRPFR